MSPTSRHALRGNQSLCAACGLLFTNTSSFDQHRAGSYASGRHCKSEAELRANGFEPNERGHWRKALTEEQRVTLFALRPSTNTNKVQHHATH